MGLLESLVKREADIDKFVNTLFTGGLPDWIPKADVEKVRDTAARLMHLPPENVGRAIGAAIGYMECNDIDGLFSRCREVNVNAIDAIYLATVREAIHHGIGNGLPLLLGGQQALLFLKAVRKHGAAKGGKGKQGSKNQLNETLGRIAKAIGSASLNDVLDAIEDDDDRLEPALYSNDNPAPIIIDELDRVKKILRYRIRATGAKKTSTFGNINNHLTDFR